MLFIKGLKRSSDSNALLLNKINNAGPCLPLSRLDGRILAEYAKYRMAFAMDEACCLHCF